MNNIQMRTRERVPGLSMRRLWIWAVCLGALSLAAAIATVVAIIVTQSTFNSPVVATLAAIFAGSMGLSFLLMYYVGLAVKAEIAVGYTTSRLGYPHVELVDESTSLVVRSAGEPLISREEYRRRVQAYRTMVLGSDDA
ncbi:hypothetical protein E3O42_04125 [Cryobacterium adonitolivorans]|uniref:Uncharacterized protein n=1 Tax=Cryobacterium adonitolivorans TaxID=1259189 RepID=A0A4R8W8Z2_9MICO|nr:hypothetical protein [Cryobacterium adonitolivorans]TFC05049.1 hypothetical protein E3O42_04125 [Cryobacterium adonitolivorans]